MTTHAFRSSAAGHRSPAVIAVSRARTRVARRTRLVTVILAVVLLVVVALSLSLGDYTVSWNHLLPAVFGSGDGSDVIVVQNLRLPRVVLAVPVGIAFGMSGAVFQSLARNPLASPDILGITAGGSLFAVVGLTLFGLAGLSLSLAATLGALLTAALIYGLAYRKGLSSYRLILMGIGVGAVAAALTQYFWTRAHTYDAASAALWLSGSLSGRGWDNIAPILVFLAVLVPAALVLTKQLSVLELGDDSAMAVGLNVQRARLLLLVVAVGLAGAGIGAAGPVAFVAFVSGPIARRLCRSPAPALLPAGLFGAILVVVGDHIGRTVVPNTEISVGILTGIIGAPYLLWLLTRTNRTGQGN